MARPLARSVFVTVVALCLVLAASWLRLGGLTRGVIQLPGTASVQEFHHFHPDEYTVIQAALALADPLQPEVTGYGMLPMYLLRGALEVTSADAGWDQLDLADPEAERRVFYIARAISVLIGCLAVILTFGRLAVVRL